MSRRRAGWLTCVLVAIALVIAGLVFVWRTYLGGLLPDPDLPWDAPSPDAVWPWPNVQPVTITPGVTHWRKTAADGTDIEVVRFDFIANPRLRFEMYDQDQDAPKPWNDHVRFYALGVAQAAAHLDAVGRGKVIAATNGMFFNATGFGPHDFAGHISPVVVDGIPHFAGGENHRWTFGVKYAGGRPQFDAYHTPDRSKLTSRFDYAAGGAQALIWNGVPAASPAEERGVESSFEKMRTSRVAWGWSADNRMLYLLFVKEPDAESASKWAAQQHVYLGGGWMLADERRFFEKLGVWRAFNSDAGDVGQMLLLRPDGSYDLAPPKTMFPSMRLRLPADRTGAPITLNAPHAGALMYWYVREAPI